MTTPLSKQVKDKIVTWSKWFPDTSLTDLKWINKKHLSIASIIDKKYTNLNTKHFHFYALSSVLKHLGNLPMSEKYRHMYTSIKTKIDTETQKQQLDDEEKKNWIPEDKLVELRESYNVEDPSISDHRKYIILSCYTAQPPIRAEWQDMKIIHNMNDDDGEHNYLFIDPKTKKKMNIVLNKYKTVKKYGKHKIIPVTIQLQTILRESLVKLPRPYVLYQLKDTQKNIGTKQFNKTLKTLSPGKNLGVDIFRSAYITNYYSGHPTYSDKQKLSEMMCNSVTQSEISYDKIF